MKTKSQLREERENLGRQLDELIVKPGDMTADDNAKFETIERDMKGIDAQLAKLERHSELRAIRNDASEQIIENTASKAEVSEKEARAAWETYLRKGDKIDEKSIEILKRATDTQSIGSGLTDVLGGITTFKTFSDQLIKVMSAFGGALANVNIIPASTGNTQTWPKRNTTARKGRLIGELVEETKNSVVYSNVEMVFYKFSSDVLLLSWDLINDSLLNMESEVMDINGESLARVVNDYLTTGTGSSQPYGFIPGGTVGITTASATAITLAELITLQGKLNPAYRGADDMWYFTDNTLTNLRKMVDSNGQPLIQRDFRSGAPDTILGKPYAICPEMVDQAATTKFIAYANLKKAMTVSKVTGDKLVVQRELYSDYHSNGYFINQRWGSVVKDATAIQIAQSHA
jgi:HK97 family phage major capsid protein